MLGAAHLLSMAQYVEDLESGAIGSFASVVSVGHPLKPMMIHCQNFIQTHSSRRMLQAIAFSAIPEAGWQRQLLIPLNVLLWRATTSMGESSMIMAGLTEHHAFQSRSPKQEN